MRACHSMAIANFFRIQGLEIDFVMRAYTSKGRRARHVLARAPTTGVRVDNGCRYHLVFTAGRRKGDGCVVGAPALCTGRPAARFLFLVLPLGSCFSPSSTFPLASPAQRAFGPHYLYAPQALRLPQFPS